MASPVVHSFSFSHFFILYAMFFIINPCSGTTRKLSSPPDQTQLLVLKYHDGPVLHINITVNIVWYGKFSAAQRVVIVDFLRSLSPIKSRASPSVSSWWSTTSKYKSGGRRSINTVVLGAQVFDKRYSLGKFLKDRQLLFLASRFPRRSNSISLVLTSSDVAVDRFCMNRCGSHGSGGTNRKRFAYAWVGNSMTQCPGQCAWPFHQPIYGPQTPPLIPPSGDVGMDAMVINLATVLAGAVTNPFKNGYFQGSADAPLEAVSTCTCIFGNGSYPGYPGQVLVDKTTGASYNTIGANGRKFLVPAIWDPDTSTCKTLT